MDVSRLKELIELMNRHQLAELEMEEEGVRVRLRKQSDRGPEVVTLPAAAAPPVAAVAGAPAAPAAPALDDSNTIKSPMVGTFYRAANPDAESFVEVGDTIEEGKVLCIVEAMKVMNEIKAERSGTIEAVLVENGDSIEFGQPLFRIS